MAEGENNDIKQYEVDCIERFFVRTTYNVEARSKEEAIEKCKNVNTSYDDWEILEGREEWYGAEHVTEVCGDTTQSWSFDVNY